MPSRSPASKVRKCADCRADISHRSHHAVRCPSCQAKEEARRRRERRATARRNNTPEYRRQLARASERRKRAGPHVCQQCGREIKGRHWNATYCAACTYARRLRSQHRSHEKERLTKPIFVHCPPDWDGGFDRWLDVMMFNPPAPPPDLNHEPETWRPFVVPEYLK